MYIPLEEGETIVLQVHKHWWFIAVRAIALALLLAVPFGAWALLRHFDLVVFTHTSVFAFLVLGALWALIGWILFWQFWTLYYMDMWIVTDRRLIDIDYRGFFDRDIAMLRLDRVQDLTVHVEGILGSLLKYGHIVVQTAGNDKEFIIDQISDPETLRDAISRLVGQTAERVRIVSPAS